MFESIDSKNDEVNIIKTNKKLNYDDDIFNFVDANHNSSIVISDNE